MTSAPSTGSDSEVRAQRAGHAMADVAGIMARLRARDGCPWDRAQSPESLRAYLLEEAYEVLEAIDNAVPQKLCEELGDLVFQVVFHAQIHSERGDFDLADVLTTLAEKLRRRHPHVFDVESAPDTRTVLQQWEQTKLLERQRSGDDISVLAGVTASLPALARVQKLGERAARVGFEFANIDQVLGKLQEELAEFHEARSEGDKLSQEHELGDVLFSLVNLARFLDISAEDALRRAGCRFEQRVRTVETMLSAEGKQSAETDPERLEALWQQAKREGQVPRAAN